MSNLIAHLFNNCSKIAQTLLPPLLPGTCELCGAGSGKNVLCAACEQALPRLPAACPVCALPTATGSQCGACLAHAPHFDATLAAYVYAPPLDQLVQALKYRGRLALAPFLAEELARRIRAASAALPHIVLAMPATPARQRERGYNQAQELARALARMLELPLAGHLVARRRDDTPQSALPWKERARNVRGAFEVVRDVEARHFGLVDDVMTTGASVAELAKTLKAAGAARVTVWVVARTLPPTN